ncbi:phytoene/squalene synthase family protein [Novosphingobium tardum]|uniref:Phytoene/squalene synthase family protein n=1 Tax=Novosphingobium tardum TaxID=1538021 RepID=A0ABV8RQX9_9SPHN
MTADRPDRASLVAQAHSAIARGSRSFSAASRLFDRTTRERVWLLYAWCRRCDDLADAQDMGGALGDQRGAAARLAIIRKLTDEALAGKPTGDPAFDAFGLVAAETGLTGAMADDVIAGFALDAADWQPHSEADLMRYCYHVAGAVGVMMAVVMGVSPADEDTLDRACDLGLAFQLANIARDIEEDDAADRCYLPMEWLAEADIPPGEHLKPHYRRALTPLVARLVRIAHAHECSARIGAGRLKLRQRWAVLSAAGIYGEIARVVERRGAHAWDHRTVVSDFHKLGWIARAAWEALMPPPRACRDGAEARLWTRRDLAGGIKPPGAIGICP